MKYQDGTIQAKRGDGGLPGSSPLPALPLILGSLAAVFLILHPKRGNAQGQEENKGTAGAAYELVNGRIKLSFGPASRGFDTLAIENRMAGNVRFVHPRPKLPALWTLTFRGKADNRGKRESFSFNNHVAAARRLARRRENGISFFWEGIDLPHEPAAVDVIVSVDLDRESEASEWRIQVKNRSRRLGLWSSRYPLLPSVILPGQGDLVAPTGVWGGSLFKESRDKRLMTYPSYSCPVQCLAFQRGEAGLYIAAHDGLASTKFLEVSKEQDMTWDQLAGHAGVAGAAEAPSYPVVIAAYRGSWWEMARIYRRWAMKQSWTAKGPIATRDDYPDILNDIALWLRVSGSPNELSERYYEAKSVREYFEKARKRLPDIKLGLHWYEWHRFPFNHSFPEYFPPKPGFYELVKSMVESGWAVMPYINGRLWDTGIESFGRARSSACKSESGEIFVKYYGSRGLATQCPYAAYWQKTMGTVCRKLVEEAKVNAIYLDQIGSCEPQPCFDPTHGHPVGGGHFWVEGYRRMLTPIKDFCAKRGVFLTTEDTAEPYMDTIDAFLTCTARHETDLPLLPAVYSGYTTYFSTPEGEGNSLDTFCALQGRDFLWGVQPGRNHWILNASQREKLRFHHLLARYRGALKAFLQYGQLVGEPSFTGSIPKVRHLWRYKGSRTMRLPIVMGSFWRARDGRLLLLMINTSRKEQRGSLLLSKQGVDLPKSPLIQEITLEGVSQGIKPGGDLFQFSLPSRQPVAYLIR